MSNSQLTQSKYRQSLLAEQPTIYRWFEQLELAIGKRKNSTPSAPEAHWSLIGNGLMVEAEDHDAYLQFLEWACETLQIDFIFAQGCELDDLKTRLMTISQPAIIFIEPSAWLEGGDISDEDFQDQQRLLELFTLIAGKPLVFTSICTSYDGIAEAFRYRGKFDRHMRWAPPQPEIYAQHFIDMVGAQFLDEQLIQDSRRLGGFLCLEFASLRRLDLLAIAVQRKGVFRSSLMGWRDMLEFAIHGLGDGGYEHPSELDLRQIAAHESGHAVMAIIESEGKHLPDWVSILPSKSTAGIVVEDYSANFNSNRFISYKRVRSTIRISLAGRVAEEMLLGALNVGADCSNQDLREASKAAMNLVCKSGFTPSFGEGESEGGNLLVASKHYVSADSEYFHQQARLLMRDQYQFVKKSLNANLVLLQSIQEALVRERLLLKTDLQRLMSELPNKDRLAA